MSATTSTPQRQIRALYDASTITVYQAYNSDIASAAVSAQRLSASPHYKPGRMTWIKPSWNWMMYRAGYSLKDKNQSRILALRMPRERFNAILANGCLAHDKDDSTAPEQARIQWDPERGPRLERLSYRSIQIGIPAALSKTWADKWIVGIEDVTEKALALKKAIDEGMCDEDLSKNGLLPPESVYDVSAEIIHQLGMDLV